MALLRRILEVELARAAHIGGGFRQRLRRCRLLRGSGAPDTSDEHKYPEREQNDDYAESDARREQLALVLRPRFQMLDCSLDYHGIVCSW